MTDVYFDDRDLILDAITAIDDSDTGVSFSVGATPGNLPAGNEASPPFITTAGLSVDSNPPAQPNGVNPGESLGLTLSLKSDYSYSDLLASLDSGALRIGIHVQGFADGGSESFVSKGIPSTPAPGALLLASIGVGIVLRGKRRFRKTL